MRRLLFAALLLASPAAAEPWKTNLAAEGCVFHWRGTGGYAQVDIAGAPAPFPLIRLTLVAAAPGGSQSRHEGATVPFCVGACAYDGVAEAVGAMLSGQKEAGYRTPEGEVVTFTRTGERVFTINGAPDGTARAFGVEVTTGGRVSTHWWSHEVGWLIGYGDPTFQKQVFRMNCPQGMAAR